MSMERDMNVAVQSMFKHAKDTVIKNLTTVVKNGSLSIDEKLLPGLELIINSSIDDSMKRSAREISGVAKKYDK